MKVDDGKRLVFGDFVDKLFWALLLALGSYAMTQITRFNENMQVLNGTVIKSEAEKQALKERVDKLESRLEDLISRERDRRISK